MALALLDTGEVSGDSHRRHLSYPLLDQNFAMQTQYTYLDLGLSCPSHMFFHGVCIIICVNTNGEMLKTKKSKITLRC